MSMDKKILVTQSSMPSFEEYVEMIRPLWDSRWLTNMGAYHRQLEQGLKAYLDVPELSMMCNGHLALELAIQAFDFPKGSEVITTPFTFISTTHAIVRNGLQPVFCDVKEDGTIDETKLEELITERTVAIVPVHVYGNVCNVEEIARIAYRYNLKVIYDAAHAFGVKYKGRGIGNFGDAAMFSFHATKVFHTIEGGAVTFAEHSLYEKLYNLKNFGIRGEELVTEIGANAKMNEFSAAMGLCNLKRMETVIAARKERYEAYQTGLRDIKNLTFLEKQEGVESNYSYCPILIHDNGRVNRDKVYDMLREENIFSRKYFYPLTSDQACFKNKYKHVELETARRLAEEVLVLPLYEELELDVIVEICEKIRHIVLA